MFDTFNIHDVTWDIAGSGVLYICPFGDTHDEVGASLDDHLDDLKRRTAKLPPKSVLFIGMGDYGDFMSTSERKAIKNSNLHETTIESFDRIAETDLKRRIKRIEFMRGRLIGLHNGNHDFMFRDSTYASERMAAALGCKHLGLLAATHIIVKHVIGGANGSTSSYVDIFSHHGKGGGKLIGTSINQIEDMNKIIPLADAYIMGHNHKKGGLPDSALEMVYNNKTKRSELREKTRYYVRSGSSMRGYVDGKAGYVSSNLMRPCSLGFPIISVEWKRCDSGGVDTVRKEVHCWA